jgi:hypothetical protein
MSIDEKVEAMKEYLVRTLANNEEWGHLYGRIIIIGYSNDKSPLPLLLPFGGYTAIAARYKELKQVFCGDVLVYFSGDKEPEFCPVDDLFRFVIEGATIRKLIDMDDFTDC